MTVIALRRKPAYTPSLPPVRCMTPGHEDREARHYPGGRLCEDCLPVAPARSRSGAETTREPTIGDQR